MLALLLVFVGCDTDVKHHIADVDAPKLVSSSPEAGADKVKAGKITIQLKYDKNVFFATENLDKIVLTGAQLVDANVFGSSNTLTISAITERDASCSLSIPEGVVLGPNRTPAPAVSLDFSTIALKVSLVNAAATPEAKRVYDYLKETYESKTLSAMTANVSWNTDESERVFQLTGKYPAMNCFDYGHLPHSGSNWIDYGDITPVEEWWNAGGLVKAMWHWNVPTKKPDSFSRELWVGEETLPADWSGSVQLTDDASKAIFADAEVGNVIKVTTSNVDGGAQGSFKNSNWAQIAPGTDYFDIDGDFELVITEEILSSLQEGGVIVGGHDYTVTGIYLTGGAAGNIEYAFYREDTSYDAANATVSGTWENDVFISDLTKISGYLKLLQDAGIPVIWRPFHEAAGGWFWWGKDADSLKKMWVAMFEFFKAEGINNLIWVWTVEGNDEEWYPGDAYVDMVGRDLYGKDTDYCVEEFTSIAAIYGDKIVSLSECGSVGLISEQWEAGARWAWFMPWYDNEGAETPHATDEWWQDAMSQSYVITRESLPDFK